MWLLQLRLLDLLLQLYDMVAVDAAVVAVFVVAVVAVAVLVLLLR